MEKVIELVKLGIISLLLGGIVLWLLGYGYMKLRVNSDCYEEGYGESRVSYNFERYCVAGVDLVPLGE